MVATISTTWKRPCFRVRIPFRPVIMIIGIAPSNAKAAPVVRFSAPGPSVARQTPGRPVNRPCVAAMKEAGCSWRVTMSLILDRRSDSTTSRFSSPGTPKIRSTPSFSKAATSRSEPFIRRPPESGALEYWIHDRQLQLSHGRALSELGPHVTSAQRQISYESSHRNFLCVAIEWRRGVLELEVRANYCGAAPA
jgi:hypothetical protein